MTRSSTPSNRPHTKTTPGPPASASTRFWVSGTPRGDSNRSGRASAAAASMARASTSAFITMPGPPPAGVSSTVRCLSAAKLRISTTSSAQAPAVSALPARLTPSGPGNMSGKMLRTEARHISAALLAGKRFCPVVLFRRTSGQKRACLRIEHEFAAWHIDARHVRIVERQQFGLVAGVEPHYQKIAGAEIVDRHDAAELLAVAIDDRKPDQVGVIKFFRIGELRQALARHIELGVGELRGGIAVVDAGQRRDEMIFRRPQRFDRDGAAVFGV